MGRKPRYDCKWHALVEIPTVRQDPNPGNVHEKALMKQLGAKRPGEAMAPPPRAGCRTRMGRLNEILAPCRVEKLERAVVVGNRLEEIQFLGPRAPDEMPTPGR